MRNDLMKFKVSNRAFTELQNFEKEKKHSYQLNEGNEHDHKCLFNTVLSACEFRSETVQLLKTERL